MNLTTGVIAYHISKYDFNKFDSSAHIGNFETILEGSYFLDNTEKLGLFGMSGYIYTVKILPKKIFTFDLHTVDHWYLATEFQELYCESLTGIYNYLNDFFEEQNIDDVNKIDCIALTNLDYLDNKKTIEYIILNDDIITILNKSKICE